MTSLLQEDLAAKGEQLDNATAKGLRSCLSYQDGIQITALLSKASVEQIAEVIMSMAVRGTWTKNAEDASIDDAGCAIFCLRLKDLPWAIAVTDSALPVQALAGWPRVWQWARRLYHRTQKPSIAVSQGWGLHISSDGVFHEAGFGTAPHDWLAGLGAFIPPFRVEKRAGERIFRLAHVARVERLDVIHGDKYLLGPLARTVGNPFLP